MYSLEELAKNESKYGFYTYQNMPLIQKVEINWNRNSKDINYNGVKPPDPHLNFKTPPNFGKNKETKFPVMNLYQIQQREPYRVQYLYNKYGGLQSKLGCNSQKN